MVWPKAFLKAILSRTSELKPHLKAISPMGTVESASSARTLSRRALASAAIGEPSFAAANRRSSVRGETLTAAAMSSMPMSCVMLSAIKAFAALTMRAVPVGSSVDRRSTITGFPY